MQDGQVTAVSVLGRMTAVLDAFTPDDGHLGVTEIARRSGLPKSTVSRLVAELVHHRFLEKVNGGVRLGLRMFELGKLSARPNELRGLAFPAMNDLRNATGQTVHLAILQDSEVVYLSILRGRDAPAGLRSRVGGRLPAHATGAGKALLAFAPPAVVDRVIERGLVACQPRTITNPDVLRRELEAIRQSGLAYSTEEAGRGVAGAASPILTADRHAIAAVSVSGRVGHFDAHRVGPAVHTAALGLGRRFQSPAYQSHLRPAG